MMHGVCDHLQLFQLPPAEQLYWGLQLRHRGLPDRPRNPKNRISNFKPKLDTPFWVTWTTFGAILAPKMPQDDPQRLQNEAQDLPKVILRRSQNEKGETPKNDDGTMKITVFSGSRPPWGL